MAQQLILHGGPIFDIGRGRFVDDKILVIEGERIKAVDSVGNLPSGDTDVQLVDVGGGSVLPGLIDCHWHLLSRSTWTVTDEVIAMGSIEAVLNAEQVLKTGVTTVRDPGCRHRGIYSVKRAIEDGLIKGPRAFVAGPNPTGSGAPPEYRNAYADGPVEMRKLVRELWRAGADWIKLFISDARPESNWTTFIRYLTDEEIAAAVDEAHLKGVRTGCHLEGLEAAKAAVAAGMDCIDHGTVLDDEVTKRMASQGTYYVPTLWAYSVETHLTWGLFGPEKAPLFEQNLQAEHRRSFQRALAAGVVIGTGTDPIDFIPARDVFVREVEALVECGMSTADALRAATINGATILGQENDLGSLEPGKYADVLVVEGNPLEDVRALARPLLVMKGAEIFLDLREDEELARRTWEEIALGKATGERIDMEAAFRRGE